MAQVKGILIRPANTGNVYIEAAGYFDIASVKEIIQALRDAVPIAKQNAITNAQKKIADTQKLLDGAKDELAAIRASV